MISLIIVKKRLNNRFFEESTQGYSNPPAGTIIDDEATNPEW